MKAVLNRFFGSATAKSSLIVLTGNLVSAGLGFITTALITRYLQPGPYGLFASASAALMLILEMSDLGVNAALVRFMAPALAEKDEAHARHLFSAAIRSRIFISLGFSALGFVMAPIIATHLLHNAELTHLLRLSFLGVLPVSTLGILGALIQAQQAFTRYALFSTVNGAAKLLFTGVLIAIGALTPAHAIIIIPLAAIVGNGVGVFLAPRSILNLTKPSKAAIRQLTSFSLWMSLWALLISLLSRTDIFMMQRYLGETAVGHYAAAYQVASLFSLIVSALGFVLNPKLAGAKPSILRQTLRRHLPYVAVLLAVGTLVFTGVGALLLPIVFGSAYEPSIPIFVLLGIGMFLYGLTVIPNAILYALNLPVLFAIDAAIQLAIKIVANLILIPRYGILAPGLSFILVNFVGFILPLICAVYFLHRQSHEE